MPPELELYKKHILRRLFTRRKIGELYTQKELMMNGLPSHMKNMKLIEAAIKELVKQRWLELHKNSACISIHYENLDEVKKYLGIL